MFGLQPRRPLNFQRRFWALAQHVLVPNDWPTALLQVMGMTPGLHPIPHTVHSARPLGSAARLRIAFVSDLHAGPTTHADQLTRAFDAVAAARPDLVLLGGDFVDHRPRDVQRLVPFLEQLAPPHGTLAVLGNHDNNTHPALVCETLAACGVRVLVNEAVTLGAPFEGVRVIGLDDHITGMPDAARVPQRPEATTILLVHQPSGVLDAAGHRVDLALAGHTHGGQIALPGGYAPKVPSGQLSRQYLAGRFALPQGGTLLVSRGVGASTVPVRWNAPADLLLVDLLAADADAAAP